MTHRDHDIHVTTLAPGLEREAWHVWLHLGAGHPLEVHASFIIGMGVTREAATCDALTTLVQIAKDVGGSGARS